MTTVVKDLPDYVLRMIDEAAELKARLEKLTAFIDTALLAEHQKELLQRQQHYMKQYYEVLCARIGMNTL